MDDFYITRLRLISKIFQVNCDYLSPLVHLVDCPEFVDLGRINRVIFAVRVLGYTYNYGVTPGSYLDKFNQLSEGSMQIDQLFAEEISNHAEITRRDALNIFRAMRCTLI